jgi:UDP-N-acetylglucosamine--N-acetylmuramyl-(pentapeptide) pyrophosphoryl-undecaprenol N-acetylglucosamine transferase
MKIAIACGGTGGHLFPGLAVAEELRQRGHDTLLLVSPKQIDAIALQGAKEQQSHALPGIGWPGFMSPRVFKFGLTLLRSWKECGEVYRDFQPTAVLGMGGFTSAIPLLLGRKLHLPTLIHESNAIPGRVTRYIAPMVNKTLLGFASCANYLRKAHCVVTGTPVRRGLARVDRSRHGWQPGRAWHQPACAKGAAALSRRPRGGAIHPSRGAGRRQHRGDQLSPPKTHGGGASVLDGNGTLL